MKKILSIMIALVGWGMMLQGQNVPNDNMMEEQALMQEQQKAIKAIFSDKEILNNYNGAVVKDGKIVEFTKANEDNGILFWHDYDSNGSNDSEPCTCRIYNPSWENINYDPCGMFKFQMLPTSTYANQTPQNIILNIAVDNLSTINSIEEVDPEVSYYSADIDLSNVFFASSNMTPVVTLFTSNQLIYDNPPYAGAFNGDVTFNRPSGMGFQFYVYHDLDLYYSLTEYYSPNNQPIYTLRSGNYIAILWITYRDPNNNNKKIYILKWFRWRVENYYLGDVGVENHDTQQAQIAVYPNPTADVVNVQLTMNNEQSNNVEIQLFDMFGKMLDVVETQNFASLQTTKIDMSPYANGVYFIKAVSEGNVLAVRKVVKNR